MSLLSRTMWTHARAPTQIYMTYKQHRSFATYINNSKLVDYHCKTSYGWGTPFLTTLETDNPSIKLMAVLAKLGIEYRVYEKFDD